MTSASPGTRRTSAAKYTEDTLDIHGLHKAALAADESLDAAADELAKAKANVRHFTDEQESRKGAITARVVDKFFREDPKTAQAAIDRQIKSDQFDDDILAEINRNLSSARDRLDFAEASFASAKAHHRTVTSRSQVLAQHLAYLAASKNAAALAAAQLTGI